MGRVSERVARGSTLALALAAENCGTVNLDTWKKALKAHPEFSPQYEAAKGKFLEWATVRLAEAKDLVNLRWLLERRYSDLFSRPDIALEVNATANAGVTANLSIPEQVLQRALEIAHGESKRESVVVKQKGNGRGQIANGKG